MSNDNPLGSASQAAWGFESARGVPDLTSLYGIQVAEENFGAKLSSEKTKNVNSYGHRLEDQRVKIDIGGTLGKNPDVDSGVRLAAHFWNWAEITNPVTGVYQWECRPFESGDTPVASPIASIYMRRYLNDSYEERINDGRCDKRTFKIDRNKILDLSQSILFAGGTHLDEPSEVAVNAAYTGQLVFDGWSDETDTRKLRLKAMVAGALDGSHAAVEGTYEGTGTIATTGTTAAVGTSTKFTTEYVSGQTIMVGTETVRTIDVITDDTHMTVTVAFSNTASSLKHWLPYGGTGVRQAITAGVWCDFIAADGERVGADYPVLRVRFMFTSGGVFTLNDEWACAQQRGQTTVSIVQKQPLTAVGFTFWIDGAEVEVEGGTIDIVKPREAYFSTGLATARRIRDTNERDTMLKFKKGYFDRTFLRLWRSGAKVAGVAKMRGDRLGTTAYYEGHDITMPNVKINKAGTDGIKGPNAYDEEIEAYAFYDPDTGTAPVTETITTSVGTLY